MIRINSVFTGLPGLPGLSSLYFRGNSQTVAQDAATAVAAMWTDLALSLANDLTIDVDNVAIQINPENGEQTAFYAVTGATVTGTLSGEVLPYTTQLSAGFRTQGVVNSRRVQGRIFIPGWTEDNNVNGTVGSGVNAFVDGTMADTIGAAPLDHVVWSRPVDGGRLGSEHSVVTYASNTEWAVLRSRRP